MGRVITILAVILLTVSNSSAQQVTSEHPIAQLDSEGRVILPPNPEIKILQEQLAAMVKARGEDQKVLAEMRNQIVALTTKANSTDQKEAAKKVKENLSEACEGYGLRRDKLEVQLLGGNKRVLTLICK